MRFFYSVVLLFSAIIFMAHSVGPGLIQNADRTGSPVATGTCNNCHFGGNFGPQPEITLLQNGVATTEYIPGETYTVRLMINTQNDPTAYGFQMTALDNNNDGTGTFQNEPAGTRLINVANRRYFEHTMRASSNTVEVEWVAPAAGSGDANFYAGGLAVNGNGSTSGDIANTAALTISENEGSATSNTAISRQVKIFPNPVSDKLFIELPEQLSIQNIQVVNMLGQAVIEGNQIEAIAAGDLSSGSYILVMNTNQGLVTKHFVKL